jgi:hypothetical protein
MFLDKLLNPYCSIRPWTHDQKITIAAGAIAERKTFGHLS